MMDLLAMMLELGEHGYNVTLRYNPRRLFHRFTVIAEHPLAGRNMLTDDPVGVLREFLRDTAGERMPGVEEDE